MGREGQAFLVVAAEAHSNLGGGRGREQECQKSHSGQNSSAGQKTVPSKMPLAHTL